MSPDGKPSVKPADAVAKESLSGRVVMLQERVVPVREIKNAPSALGNAPTDSFSSPLKTNVEPWTDRAAKSRRAAASENFIRMILVRLPR